MTVTSYELFDAAAKSQLLRLETADGLVGWGEPTVEGRPEPVAAVVERLLEEYVLGADAERIEDHWQAMYRSAFYRGGPDHMSAIAGIDQALWDLKGKRHGLPVHQLLGGKARDRVKVYQWIHGESVEALAADAGETVDDGYRALKFNATGKLRRIDTPAAVDAAGARLAAVRETVGDEVDVGVDFHGRASKSMARGLVDALEPHGPMFVEEPIRAEQAGEFARLARHTGVPIATGERLFSRWDFRPFLEADAVDVVQPDLSHAGGITEVKKIAAMAETYDVALAPHCPLGPVALAASLQVDACSPNALIQEAACLTGLPDYLDDPSIFDLEGGFVDVPGGPGLGIEIDAEAAREAEGERWTPGVWRHGDGGVAEQ